MRVSADRHFVRMPLRLAGRITEIWRYPISSVGGERVSRANLRPDGVDGDRQYGLIDATTGMPAVPEMDVKWRKALHLGARTSDSGIPIIAFPDGQHVSINNELLNHILTDYFGFATAIAVDRRGIATPIGELNY